VEADNDYFDFWLPRNLRPDHDYTQGLRLSVVRETPPRWFPAFARRGTPCDAATGEEPCGFASFELGQELYTPTYDAPVPIPGERPYAAWLFLGAAHHRLEPRFRRTLSLRLGVTGVPALGEAVQIALHRLRGFRRPLGWDHQVPFEPALEASMAEERTAVALSLRGVRVLELTSRGRASVGNWLTGAGIGAAARAGYGLIETGREPRAGEGPRVSAYAVGSVREDWVLHDLTLDGSTFGESPRVEKRPFVLQGEVGGGVRFGPVSLEYRAVYRGQEYETGPVTHHWGSLRLAVGRAAPDES
jgi:hypothetical protein